MNKLFATALLASAVFGIKIPMTQEGNEELIDILDTVVDDATLSDVMDMQAEKPMRKPKGEKPADFDSEDVDQLVSNCAAYSDKDDLQKHEVQGHVDTDGEEVDAHEGKAPKGKKDDDTVMVLTQTTVRVEQRFVGTSAATLWGKNPYTFRQRSGKKVTKGSRRSRR